MQTQVQKIQHVVAAHGLTDAKPDQLAQFLADTLGLPEAQKLVEEIILEVERDVADWDFWTDVQRCLLH